MKIKIPTNKRIHIVSQLIEKQQIIIESNLKRLAIDIKNEKPNLIFYDFISLHAKYVLRFLFDQSDDELVAPFVVLFSTFFLNDKNIEDSVRSSIPKQEILKETKIRLKAYQQAKKFELSYRDPYKEIYEIDSNFLNIVFTFPELQPKSHLFQKNNKFVGSCICTCDDEEVDNKLIVSYLEKFPPQNPNRTEADSNNKLMYVSLGEFSDNMQLYLTIINAFKDDNENFNLDIIVSVGEKSFYVFNEMIENDELKLANNMIIVPRAPQAEILKRASLFITNADMNSMSESVIYAVPMICIPLTAEQLQTAYRVTTELGLGVTLDFLNLKTNDVKFEVINILEDSSFFERCKRYSKISQEYDGPKNAADYIFKFLN